MLGLFVVWKKLLEADEIRCVLGLQPAASSKAGPAENSSSLFLIQVTEEEAGAWNQLSTEWAVSSPSQSPTWWWGPELQGNNLPLHLLGELTGRTPHWWTSAPCSCLHRRRRTTPDTLQSEYLRSALWAATHESFVVGKVSEWPPQEIR